MTYDDTERITVTDDHLSLLRRMYVGWQDCEYGAPEVDPSRGSRRCRSASARTATATCWDFDEDDPPPYDDGRARSVHEEMQAVVAVALANPGEPLLGSWERPWLGSWQRVEAVAS